MRVCPNSKCTGFGRIVYSLATRCPLCRWDLQFIRPVSEVTTSSKPERQAPARH